ncbi:hypothetical protein OUZ56_030974 [Daphnia magna]|uniref:Uncharacterized protein n=1 Tax=Daphnia magna TaxID=35525 RepID=A0ABQ9ZSU8_9CRUS|nr:hypothetical protein OUZ56_030974 [Daphnia magna]
MPHVDKATFLIEVRGYAAGRRQNKTYRFVIVDDMLTGQANKKKKMGMGRDMCVGNNVETSHVRNFTSAHATLKFQWI